MKQWIGAWIAASLWVTAAQAGTDPILQQRQWFGEARAALDAGHMQQFQTLQKKLSQYPLTPYLEIWQAWKEPGEGNDRQVADVLKRNADIPESADLYLAWIESLAERGQWPHVARHLERFPAARAQLPEIAMLSLWYNGKHKEALGQFGEYWCQGRHFQRSVQQLEKAWLKAGHPQVDEAWQRIGVLANRGKWSEIRRISKALPKNERAWVRQWQRMQHEPLQALQQWSSGGMRAHPAQLMLTDALRRLSYKDPEQAWAQLKRLGDAFEAEQLHLLQRRIALRGARQHLSQASAWLAALPAGQQDAKSRAWQVRLHLLQGAWDKALATIKAMPAVERDKSRWRYWRARCLAASGRPNEAKRLFADLAKGRGYHSFLAAEYTGQPYRLQNAEPQMDSAAMDRVARLPGIRRAQEWLQLQEPGKAGREWYAALADADPDTWEAAAGLANLWGWYDRTIYSTYRAGANDALSYRFPLGFETAVAKMAKKNGLHASLIWSVIRQESGFNMQAVSRTGARGLMQLMPGTAKALAKGHADLFDPAENIRLGSRYLARLSRRFDGNEAIAVAAYNAGPTRVSGWLERTPFRHADIWVEAIPYAETRRYVQQVLAFMIVYDWRQSKEPVSLTARMQFTPASDETSQVAPATGAGSS